MIPGTASHACGSGTRRFAPSLVSTLKFAVLELVVALVLAAPASAQTVRGLVLEAVTYRPIELATVSLVSESGDRLTSTLTTEDGFFSLEANGDGLFLVRVVALGYRVGRVGPFDLEDEGMRVIEVTLEPEPVDLEGLVVEGGATTPSGNWLADNGFWERYEKGRGQFLGPGDIAASDAMFTPHLFRELDHIVPDYAASPWTTWVRFRGASERGNCTPRLFVDKVWMNRPGTGYVGFYGLDEIVPIEIIAGIEVFGGPFQAPMTYQGTTTDNPCGVILIWTKRR